jgi:sialidase-1
MKKLHFIGICLLLAMSCSNNPPIMASVSKITSATAFQETNYTGRSNDNEIILKLTISKSGDETIDLKNMIINLAGTTNINDIESIKIYNTNRIDFLDLSNTQTALISSAIPTSGNLTINTNCQLNNSFNVLWITFKIKENASEGNLVDASVISLTTNNDTFTLQNGNPTGARTILLGRTQVFGPGDLGSTNYRIPAIITANDGSLVTLTDKRKFNSSDLPQDIDIVCRRSLDNGKTWTTPITVAQGNGVGSGFGDAVLVKAKSGKLIAVYVGGVGLGTSSASNPMRTYTSISTDNGINWTSPRDITYQLFGSGCSDALRKNWNASFCGSGHGLCLRSGRIMVVGAVYESPKGSLQNYAYYSDDEGQNWQVSNRAIAGGDEAKVVELNNGDILMSSRTTGNRLWAISSDGGMNWGTKNSWTDIWGNACNGDMIRYTSTIDGKSKNRLLHTLPNDATRKNVTVFMSYDEGKTWPVKKTLCEGTSAYSSLTILPDGTIGAYIEEDETNPYKMVFVRFSLNWLTNGSDIY